MPWRPKPIEVERSGGSLEEMELALAKSAWSAGDKCQWKGSKRRGCRRWRNGRTVFCGLGEHSS